MLKTMHSVAYFRLYRWDSTWASVFKRSASSFAKSASVIVFAGNNLLAFFYVKPFCLIKSMDYWSEKCGKSIKKSSSPSCCAISTDFPDPLQPPFLCIASVWSLKFLTLSALASCPNFARLYQEVHRSMPLLLRQCPACMARLTWIDFVMRGGWLYS